MANLKAGGKIQLWLYLIIATLLGSLIPYAFAPYDYYLYIYVPYLFLFWIIGQGSPFRAFLFGLAFGCGEFFSAMSWMYSFGRWIEPEFIFGISVINSFILFYLALISMALPALISTWWLKYLSRDFSIITVPAIFGVFEWIRSTLFTGLPYFQPGFLFVDTPLAGLAPVTGVLGMTTGFFFSVAVIIYLFEKRQLKYKSIALTSLIIVFFLSFLLTNISWSKDEKSSYLFRVIHGATKNEDKKHKQSELIDTYLDFSTQSPRPDLVIWPEGSVRGKNNIYQKVAKKAKVIKQEFGTDILLGGYVASYNKQLNVLLRADNLKTLYTKIHLIPFGEYTPDIPIPFLNLGQHLPEVNKNTITKGRLQQKIAKLGDFKFKVAICFEIMFGSELRQTEQDYGFYVNISDLAWFTDTKVAHQILQMARLLALELSKPVLRATNYGISSIINHQGKVIVSTDGLTAGYVDARISPQTGFTPYVKYADLPLLIFLSLILCLIAIKYFVKVGRIKKIKTTI